MQQKHLAVVGVGYVGLPVALLARERGWNVVGIDVERKVAALQQGQSLLDVDTDQRLAAYPIEATVDFAAAATADVIVVAVPTPVTESKEPDLGPLKAALTSLRPHLRTGQVLAIESTINPGVMDEVVVPLLRERSDLVVDADTTDTDAALFVVHCPERINPGDATWSVRNISRVLGGYTATGTAKAARFYQEILDPGVSIKIMQSVTEAEAVKILENTFRDVNIAFVNEMAKSFTKLGIDITNVIEGASTKPFAFMPHYPGNGVGGHCISVDPYYMIERARSVGFDHEFLKLARSINDSMPAHSVELLVEGLQTADVSQAGAKVALLGLSYKKNVADLRESPALKVRELLGQHEFAVSVFDPLVLEQSTVATLAEALQGAQAVMLACNHDALIAAVTPALLAKAGVRVVVDGKNSLDGAAFAAAGIHYYGIGKRHLPVTQTQNPKSEIRNPRMAAKS